MEKELKVRTKLLTKEYSLAQTRIDKLKTLFSIFQNKVPTFWALKGVSLDVYSGETIGIIGLNGSGKSTLSNIISGITPQTSGELEINGEVSIISIGAGLNNNLTGRENIRMKCLMLGEKIKKLMPKSMILLNSQNWVFLSISLLKLILAVCVLSLVFQLRFIKIQIF